MAENRDTPMVREVGKLAEQFTGAELEELWSRYEVLDCELKAEEEVYESLFQSGPTPYYFYEMPDGFGIPEFVASWGD